jgi:YEATS domain-containing protein 4
MTIPPPPAPVEAPSSSSIKEDRLSNTTAFLPIVYGSIAFYLGKKADEFQTHEWTLFLRGPNNEDLSTVVSKVVFQLHASFAQPIREYTEPPFEVTERGWGEFEAQIRIHWKDPTEKVTIVSWTTRAVGYPSYRMYPWWLNYRLMASFFPFLALYSRSIT